MLVEDVITDAHVNGDGNGQLISGGQNTQVAMREFAFGRRNTSTETVGGLAGESGAVSSGGTPDNPLHVYQAVTVEGFAIDEDKGACGDH